MTGGGLIQITSIGYQDIYLIGDPEISLFKSVYKRHTHFSVETIEEKFDSDVDFGNTCTKILPRVGDLLSNIILKLNIGTLNPEFYEILKNNEEEHCDEFNDCPCAQCIEDEYKDTIEFGWVNSLGHAIIDSVSLEIGGIEIDKQYGEWLEIWSELTLTEEKKKGYNNMVGKVDPNVFSVSEFCGDMELYVPLQFWFCRNIGWSLPIMSLWYQDVKLIFKFKKFEQLWVSAQPNTSPKKTNFDASLLIDYIYLDIDERKKFSKESQIYLIEQLQYSENNSSDGCVFNLELSFNHPVKELIWLLQREDAIGYPNGVYPNTNYPIGNDWFNFSTFAARNNCKTQETFCEGSIYFNGEEIFRKRESKYFRIIEPYKKHTRIPNNYIYSYSFSLNPENCQPSGQVNFSRVQSTNLKLLLPRRRKYTNYNMRCYAVNYNILIITGGMGGLLFQT